MQSAVSDQSPIDIIDQQPLRAMQFGIVFICVLLNILDGFDVLAMSFTASSVSAEWDLPAVQLGIVFSAALAGMVAGALFLAPLADVYGRRSIIITCLVIISVGMLLTGLVESLWQLITLRAITGFGIGGMLASLVSMVSEYTPGKHRNLAISIVQASYPVGAVLGGVIVAPVIPVYGWRVVFIGGGLLSLLVLIVVVFLLPESLQFLSRKRPSGALNKINRILARMGRSPLETLPKPPDKQPDSATVASLLASGRRANTLRLWGAFLMSFATLYFLISWVPKMLVDSGLPLDKSIYAAATLNLGGALGIVALGHLSSYWQLTRLITVFFIAGTIGMIAFAYSSLDPSILLASAGIIGFFVFGGFVNLYTVAARIYPSEIRATGVGWAIGLGRIGAVIGPYIGGVLISSGISSIDIHFLLFSIPLIFASFCAITIKMPKEAELLPVTPVTSASSRLEP